MRYIITNFNQTETFVEPESLREWVWLQWKVCTRYVRKFKSEGKTKYTIRLKDRENFLKENCEKT